MASASSTSAKNLFVDSKTRLAERVQVNINNMGSICRQVNRGSQSADMLTHSARNMALQVSIGPLVTVLLFVHIFYNLFFRECSTVMSVFFFFFLSFLFISVIFWLSLRKFLRFCRLLLAIEWYISCMFVGVSFGLSKFFDLL